MTAPAQAALHILATGDKQLAPGLLNHGPSRPASGGAAPPAPAFSNVRVNDPSLDTHQVDQTTQSETTIAVAGSNVAVGYNDSQQTGLFLTAGSNLSGYSYSTDGGASFTDGGTTFGTPGPVYRPPFEVFYTGDKEAIAAGPDPTVKTRDDVYVAWDDFSFNFNTGEFFTGLPVAHSTDGGATWQVVYADKFDLNMAGCSFQQYIGATPIVDGKDGTLYVVAEKLAVNDPDCTGTAPLQLSESIFRSTDGGQTFGPGVKIADVTQAVPDGLLFLGPGRYMRNLELPTIALRGNAIDVAWNDGAQGKSHIRLAASTDGGQSWSLSSATQGSGDEVQPALSADSKGIHLLYYQRNKDNTLDVLVGNSPTGAAVVTRRVTTRSFQGTLTIPQFDPIIAFGYMGDYIANVSDGSRQYFAWGDNRNGVTDFLFPSGRNDPDVFLAVQ